MGGLEKAGDSARERVFSQSPACTLPCPSRASRLTCLQLFGPISAICFSPPPMPQPTIINANSRQFTSRQDNVVIVSRFPEKALSWRPPPSKLPAVGNVLQRVRVEDVHFPAVYAQHAMFSHAFQRARHGFGCGANDF